MHVAEIARGKPFIIINVTYNRDQSVRFSDVPKEGELFFRPSHMHGHCRTRRFGINPAERQIAKNRLGKTFATVAIHSTMPRVRRQDQFQGWRYQSVCMVKDFQRERERDAFFLDYSPYFSALDMSSIGWNPTNLCCLSDVTEPFSVCNLPALGLARICRLVFIMRDRFFTRPCWPNDGAELIVAYNLLSVRTVASPM